MPLIIDREFTAAGGVGCGRDGCTRVEGGVRGRLLIWRITESEEQLAGLVTEADRRAVEGYRAAGRRREALAWRAALRAVLPDARLGYDRRGAPVLMAAAEEEQGTIWCKFSDSVTCAGRDGAQVTNLRHKWKFISVSHSGPLAAVLLAGAPCGVDIERADRDFSRAAPRFISSKERVLQWVPASAGMTTGHKLQTCASESPERIFPAAVWCAKEALYKLSGREQLSLLDDIRISALDLAPIQWVPASAGMTTGGHKLQTCASEGLIQWVPAFAGMTTIGRGAEGSVAGSAVGSVAGGAPVEITFLELDGYLVAFGVDMNLEIPK